MKQIPIHLLKDKTKLGFQLKRLVKGEPVADTEAMEEVHRDDHYIFFLLERGHGCIAIDFNEVMLPSQTLYYVLPHQVHQRIRHEADGWYVAVDISLVPAACRKIFEGNLFLQQPRHLEHHALQANLGLLALLWNKYQHDAGGIFEVMGAHALLHAFIAAAAAAFLEGTGQDHKLSRPAQLTAQFKALLTAEMRTLKRPSAYAARLHVSETYLSEVLRQTTGFPASYWIQQEIIIEAKRLLYYSASTVKEIAFELGYMDHSYFSRLFRKVTGYSANTFREQYRK